MASAIRRRIEHVQNVSRMCLVCGRENPLGLQARYYELAGPDSSGADATDGHEILGVFTPAEHHQSYPGRLHGGVSSAILDETIGRALLLFQPDVWGVTVEFNARFRKPLPLDDEIRCVARITRDTRKLFEGTGEILLADGTVAVSGWGKYLKQPLSTITGDDSFLEREWFADPRDAPEDVEI